jgi:hypothetical protein
MLPVAVRCSQLVAGAGAGAGDLDLHAQ